MKSKHFILTTAFALLCALGCACQKEQPKDSSVESPQDSVIEETVEVISVNQSFVAFCVGESFTLIAEADNVETAEFSWTVDGDADEGVVSLVQTGNVAVITALKKGTTKLVASVKQGESIYFKTVDVTVKEGVDVSLTVSDNVGFDNNGYHVQLSTLPTAEGGETSIVPLVTAYKNNKIVSGVTFSWESEDTSIVKTEGNKLVSVSEGSTHVVGTCQIEGKEYSLSISVDVCRPTIRLEESFTVETENLSTLAITSTINGTVRDVLYNGRSVGSFDVQGKTVTLEKSKLPTLSAEMGEGRSLIIETNLASYEILVNMYTKILKTAEDFDSFATLSKKACPTEPAIWDGYFVLGNDIVYNGLYQSRIADIDSLWLAVEGNWSNGGLYGFRGVFDGKGHNIEGVSVDNGAQIGSIFGVLHIDGVVKNISFTKASVAANSSFVCGAGGGTVENIYIQYDWMGKGAQHYEGDGSINTYCASFFGFKEPTATANVSNCVVDVTKATFNAGVGIKIIGSEYVSNKNTFVIGGTDELRGKSNATLSFSSVIDFVEDVNAQSRYKKFNEDFWSLEYGVPVSNVVFESVCSLDVHFTGTANCLVSGTAYRLLVDNSYVKFTADNANVEIKSGVASVSSAVESGEKVTITATSIFDESKQASFTCDLAVVDKANCLDLTKEKETAFYDATLDRVYFADLKEKVTGEVLYYVDDMYASATFAKDGEDAKVLYAVTQDKFYKFHCLTVTKVIEKAEDLHYVRKDYTVSSYGNEGCYDGRILGTFVLLNDIDCTGLHLKNSGRYWENSRGFGGIFDGRGYTISNLTVSENGLFGALAFATIKNVNFTGICLKAANQGAYVSLFASRVFNTTIENVSMQFAEYVVGDSIYATSGLMFYETSFDSTFKNLTIDISKISGVKYLTESYYNADKPYLSEKKSVYENITVILASLDERPAFAYKTAEGTAEDIEQYPDGFTFQTA